MLNQDQINQEIELVSTLKLLAQSYEEISVLRIQNVKGSVLATRDFLEKLSEVYMDVRTNYKHAIADLEQRHRKRSNVLLFKTNVKNGKEVSVFVSANSKFYGGVVEKVFILYKDYILKHDTELVVIGKVGKELMENAGINKQFTFYDVPDTRVSLDNLQPVMQYITNFEKVNVFYPRFLNMVSQDPAMVHLSGEDIMPNQNAMHASYTKYFFEPSLAVILEFFESQVLTSDFKQTVHEGELARLAGRIRAMEEMLSNIEDKQKELGMQSLRLKKSTDNKKRIESLAGMFLWTRA